VHLVFLGALRLTPVFDVTFGAVFQEFVDRRDDEIVAVLALVQDVAGLPDETMSMYEEKASGWRRPLEGDEPVLWLRFLSRMRDDPVVMDDAARIHRLVQHAADCQLKAFIGAMILAAADRERTEPTHLANLHAAAVSGAALSGADDPVAIAKRAYVAWCVTDLGALLVPDSHATDDARRQLRAVADGLDVLFDRYG
jgi:hypothetical protein